MSIVVVPHRGKLEVVQDLFPTAWFDSMDNSTITESAGDVSQWSAKGTGSTDLTQATGTNQPSLLDVGGRQMVSFDGVDEYLQVVDAGASALKFGSGDFSIYLVYRTTDTNRGMMVEKGFNPTVGYFARINDADTDNGDFVFAIRDSTATLAAIRANDIDYNDGTVRLAALVREGTNIRMYQDGTEVSESPVSASGVGRLDTSDTFYMGTHLAGSQWYAGELGDVMFFDRALSAGQRAELTDFLKERWAIS